MTKRIRGLWWLPLVLGVAAACQDDIIAPGACPEYCPDTTLELVDSLLPQVVLEDSAVRGYVRPQDAATLQLAFAPGGTGVRSRGVVRFIAFPENVLVRIGDTIRSPVLETDSFRIELAVTRRLTSIAGLELRVFRLPADTDTLASFTDLDPFFADSTRLATIRLADSLTNGVVGATLPGTAFPTFDADGRRAAVGIALAGPSAAWVEVGTTEGNARARLTRFVQIDSSGTQVARSEARDPALDLYVDAGLGAAGAADLIVGGAPSARTFLRLAVPPRILDSAEVVLATLELVPASPVVGAPGDTLAVLAHALTADLGPKSPFDPIPPDSLRARSGLLVVGSTDTLRIDVTDILRAWQADPTRPRVMLLRASAEGGRLAEGRFRPLGTPARPVLRVTFIPPLRLGAR